jgi:hypothetical protein
MTDPHRQFCQAYGIEDPVRFTRLYELDEILLFLPPQPTDEEKHVLGELIGTLGVTYGFMDYVKSNNTFELIMQWREKTGNL